MISGSPLEAAFPKLIADHRHGVRVAPRVLARLESAPKHGMNAHGVKIVGRDDAARGDLGAVANAERSPHDFGDDEGINERANSSADRASPARRCHPGPGSPMAVPVTASSCFLVRLRPGKDENRIPSIQLNNSGIGPDPKSQAKDGEKRKAGTAPEHAKAESENLA